MRSDRICLKAAWLLLCTSAASGMAQVVSSEFFSDPVSEGWDLFQKICAEAWIDDGRYFQQFDFDTCSLEAQEGQDAYSRSITEFNDEPRFFLQFSVQTYGDRSEIPLGAPIVIAIGNFFGVSYHITVASDLVKFLRDVSLPVSYFEIEPDVTHTYRVELYPTKYLFYIDGNVMDEWVPEGPFPSHDARATWHGRWWRLPGENAWDYIRYGVIPMDASGDYDSDTAVTLEDFYFFHECLTNQRPGINGGPGEDAGPGCRFADFDYDSDVDMKDLAHFQESFISAR